jgi:hypothetical protein
MNIMRLIRISAMHDRRAFPLALITIATVAAATGCGSSGSKPATPTQPTDTHAVTTTQPAARLQKFTSQRYSFHVTLTKDWSENDAVVAWNGKKLQGLDSAAFANFNDPADRTLAAAAARVAKGTALARWKAAMVRAAPVGCSNSSSVEQTTLGGEPALAWTSTCSDGAYVHKLATVHGDRGYVILFASAHLHDDPRTRHIFESIRRSFRFTS